MTNFYVDADIRKAKTLNTEFYITPAIFNVSKERIFAKSWHFITHSENLQSHNCYPFTLLPSFINEPLLLTKYAEDDFYCLSNVCTHRGNLVITEACKTTNLRCKYHGRIFQLDGKFKSMPEFKEVENFPTPSDDLYQLPVYRFGNLLFTSLHNMMDPALFFSDMHQRLHWIPFTEFKWQQQLSKEYFVDAHWALYCENYLEGFHIPFVHSGLNAVIDYSEYTTEIFPYSNLQLGIAKEDEDCFDLPTTSPDYGKRIAAYYFWVFPNMMFNFYPWGLSLNIVQPIAINKTKVSFYTYIWKEEKYNRGAGSDLDKVEMEDEEIVQQVQKGVQSRFYTHGRYSATREQGTHHFHRLIAEFMN
jgi:choline monooxygenase